MKKQQIILGALPGVEECWLVLRGMKTMEIRMNKSSETALKIAEYLQRHPKIQKVYYPGLKNHEGYETNKKQSSGGGAVLSFDLGCCEKVRKFFKLVKYPIVAVSLGGVESILSYPYKMSHAPGLAYSIFARPSSRLFTRFLAARGAQLGSWALGRLTALGLPMKAPVYCPACWPLAGS